MRVHGVAAVWVVAVLAGGGQPAQPAREIGPIVFTSDRGELAGIYSIRSDGGNRRKLTADPGGTPHALTSSPNGRWIAYQRESADSKPPEIFVTNRSGTAERRIGAGYDPAWSPDGRRLVFAGSAGRLTVVTVAGPSRVRHLRAGGHLPSWSPDGTRIAYLRLAGSSLDLRVVRSDGRRDRPIARGFATWEGLASAPAWSPDSKRIAFAGGPRVRGGDPGHTTIYVTAVSGGRPIRIAPTRPVKRAPRWSPDGARIAFLQGRALFVTRPDGRGRTRLARNASEQGGSGAPAWSPDGTRIAFQGQISGQAPQVFVVDRRGGRVRRLTRGARISIDETVDWSSDGRRVYFAADAVAADTDLFTIRPDGRALRRLTANGMPEWGPAWSPDGRRIAFARAPGDDAFGEADIFVIEVQPRRLLRLTRRAGADRDPTWSPDGGRIAFVCEVSRFISSICVMRSDGTATEPLTEPRPGVSDPAWSPDGSSIAFIRGGELMVMNADGTSQRRLARIAEQAIQPRWSPDGGTIAVGGMTECGRDCIDAALYLVLLDGSVRTLAVAATAADWSPDGSRLVVSDGDLSIMGPDGRGRRRLTSGATSDLQPDWRG